MPGLTTTDDRQLWRCCRLEPLPRRRAMMARSAQSQGSVALRAACSKDMEQRWSRTSETNMGCQTAGSGDAANIIWEVERFLHMLHAWPDYADFPTASASSQGHDGHLPRVPDVVRWFFDCGVSELTYVKNTRPLFSAQAALTPLAAPPAARSYLLAAPQAAPLRSPRVFIQPLWPRLRHG